MRRECAASTKLSLTTRSSCARFVGAHYMNDFHCMYVRMYELISVKFVRTYVCMWEHVSVGHKEECAVIVECPWNT